MARTLLVGHPGVSWRTWLHEHRDGADVLVLDPMDATQGPLARFVLWRGGRPVFQRFYGGLDVQRAPHMVVSALAQALGSAGDSLIVQCFAYRQTPLIRQTLQAVNDILRPDHVFSADNMECPVDSAKVELEELFPTVAAAQRKAQWLKLLEACSEHEVAMDAVRIEGARLGSGVDVTSAVRSLAISYAERCGNSLLIVAKDGFDDGQIPHALDLTGTRRAQLVTEDQYTNLLCSFARAEGDDFGMGFVQEIDWESRRMMVLCAAVPPAPVKVLRLGTLRVDQQGNELGEYKPWQV